MLWAVLWIIIFYYLITKIANDHKKYYVDAWLLSNNADSAEEMLDVKIMANGNWERIWNDLFETINPSLNWEGLRKTQNDSVIVVGFKPRFIITIAVKF